MKNVGLPCDCHISSIHNEVKQNYDVVNMPPQHVMILRSDGGGRYTHIARAPVSERSSSASTFLQVMCCGTWASRWMLLDPTSPWLLPGPDSGADVEARATDNSVIVHPAE